MIGRRYLIAGAFAGAGLATAGSALAQQATVGIQTVTTYSLDARITAVDPAARTVSLAFANGATATRNVSQAVADFGARKVGDMVSVGFEDTLTFVLSGPFLMLRGEEMQPKVPVLHPVPSTKGKDAAPAGVGKHTGGLHDGADQHRV